ncbi:anthranilate phosphoribosyltransferase [Tulasnella sp. 419]|nr:anthranilate phosphoribosyltransferase [Tulasnella sp. 419]
MIPVPALPEKPKPETFKPLLQHLVERPDEFSREESRQAFHHLAQKEFGGATAVQIGAFLMALKYSGKAHDDKVISAAADVMREYAIRVTLENGPADFVVDIVGTGAIAPIRKSLPFRTIFNVLGPLLNPARPRGMVLGVYTKSLGPVFARALRDAGVERFMVVCGDEGLDEISIAGGTHVWELDHSRKTEDGQPEIKDSMVHPAHFGLNAWPLDMVAGSTPDVNAKTLRWLLGQESTPPVLPEPVSLEAITDFVLINASALLVVAGVAKDFIEGVDLARDSMKSGKAWAAIDAFVRFGRSQ